MRLGLQDNATLLWICLKRVCCRTLEYLRGKCIQAGFGSSGLWTNCSLRVWLYPVRCIVRKASSCALCSLNPPVPVLSPPISSHLAGFHLPWSWQKDDDGNPKKFLCPWKCFAPDLKLFEKWLCKYAVSVFSFFQISFTMKLKKRWWREPKKVFVSLKMLRAWSEIIWKMALQVRSFCFFFFSAIRTSNCANSSYLFLYLHPRFSYIFHLTAVTWVLVFNIDTAERKERQTNPNEASPLFALLNRFETDS